MITSQSSQRKNSQNEILTTTIMQEMEKVEMGCKMPWKQQKGNLPKAKKSARNVILLYSYARKEMDIPLGKLSRDEYYDTGFINDMEIISYPEEQYYKYSSNNPAHQKRIVKLLG